MRVGKYRANAPVKDGPAGLDSWCVVASDPSGVLRKPAGTVACRISGLASWVNVDGTAAGWITLSAGSFLTAAQIAKLAAATLAQFTELGQIQAGDFAKLHALAPASWLDTRAAEIAAAAPGTTRLIPIDLRAIARDADITNAGAVAPVPGGGVVFGNNAFKTLTSDYVVANPTTASWAVVWRQQMAIPSNGPYFMLGLAKDGNNFIAAMNQYGQGGDSNTKIGLKQLKVGSTDRVYGNPGVVIDVAWHNWMLAGNTVGVGLYRDGSLVVESLFSAGVTPLLNSRVFVLASGAYMPVTDLAYAF